METKRKKKKWLLILLLILLLLVIGGGLFWFFCHNKPPTPQPDLDNQAVEWEGKQPLDNAGNGSGGYISIPCFEALVFKENQTTQKVNLYNPENNTCYMVISLVVDEETLWQSEMIAPNTGFYEIELEKELAAGNYKGMIIYDCFSAKDLTPLNGGSFQFKLEVR